MGVWEVNAGAGLGSLECLEFQCQKQDQELEGNGLGARTLRKEAEAEAGKRSRTAEGRTGVLGRIWGTESLKYSPGNGPWYCLEEPGV